MIVRLGKLVFARDSDSFAGGRGLAFTLALGLHVGLAAFLTHATSDIPDAAEDIGLTMTLELAPTPAAQPADDISEPAPDSNASAASPPAPPTPETEEKLSPNTTSEQPKAETTPYETPPDSLARRETERKADNKTDEPEATDAMKPEPAAPAAAAAAPSQSGEFVSRDDENSAAPQQGSALDGRDTPQSWQRALLKHLGRHKKYPQGARHARQEGVATIEFVVGRNGKVSDVKLVKSSGVESLDREALAMLPRAEPLPALPPEAKSGSLRIVLPVRYRLR